MLCGLNLVPPCANESKIAMACRLFTWDIKTESKTTARRQRSGSGYLHWRPRDYSRVVCSPMRLSHTAPHTIDLTLMNVIREDNTLFYQRMAARTAVSCTAHIFRHPVPHLTDVSPLCSVHDLDESQATNHDHHHRIEFTHA